MEPNKDTPFKSTHPDIAQKPEVIEQAKSRAGGIEDFIFFVGERYTDNQQLSQKVEGLPLFKGDDNLRRNLTAFERVFQEGKLITEVPGLYKDFYTSRFNEIVEQHQRGETADEFYLALHFLQTNAQQSPGKDGQLVNANLSRGEAIQQGLWMNGQLMNYLREDVQDPKSLRCKTIQGAISQLLPHFGVNRVHALSIFETQFEGVATEVLAQQLVIDMLKQSDPISDISIRDSEYLLERAHIDFIAEPNTGERTIAADVKRVATLEMPTAAKPFCEIRAPANTSRDPEQAFLVPIQTLIISGDSLPIIMLRITTPGTSGFVYESLDIKHDASGPRYGFRPLTPHPSRKEVSEEPQATRFQTRGEQSFHIFRQYYLAHGANEGLFIAFGETRQRLQGIGDPIDTQINRLRELNNRPTQ